MTAQANTTTGLAERRLQFLLELGDALRKAPDPASAQLVAAEALGRRLGVGRVGYGEIDPEESVIHIERDWTDGAMGSLSGQTRPLSGYAEVVTELRAGRILRLEDVGEKPASRHGAAYAAMEARALMIVPLIKDGRFRALLYLHDREPRAWTDDEAVLAGDVAERTWDAVERARAEMALRESEARFRDMADCAPAPVWVTSAHGGVEFINQAFADYAGLDREQLLGEVWVGLIHPEDVMDIVRQREEARRDFSAYKFEARFRRFDGEWRVMQASAKPRFDAAGAFRGYVGLAIDVTEARNAERHQRLLINELNHRVKNTLATVQSIAYQTLREGVSGREARDLMISRLLALSAAHDILTRENWESAELRAVAFEAVRPYEGVTMPRFTVEGPPLRVGPKVALALSMALHELATNAVKYGALSVGAGRVSIRWTLEEAALALEWRESGGPPVTAPSRKGFGSRLLQQGLATDLRGAAELLFEPGGVVCRIRTPRDALAA